MEHIRLKNTNDNYFNEAWKLYNEAFPIEERRLLDSQFKIMKKLNYHFDIATDKKQFIGFLLWWEFETLHYIDHFATLTEQRNKGFGKLILENFIKRSSRPILLEVELPDSSINKRRIKFYERLGFKLNQHYYEIPASKERKSPLQLLIMSYPTQLPKNDIDQFVKICHPIIFND